MLDLYHATRDELIQIILQQRETIVDLERQATALAAAQEEIRHVLTQLTAQVGTTRAPGDDNDPSHRGTPTGMPGLKPTQTAGCAPRPRKRRAHGAGRHLEHLFVFVTEPNVPATNNAAERSLRHLVVHRKISGGTRSPRGTQMTMTLASLFGTWRLQGINPCLACRDLLVSPQV